MDFFSVFKDGFFSIRKVILFFCSITKFAQIAIFGTFLGKNPKGIALLPKGIALLPKGIALLTKGIALLTKGRTLLTKGIVLLPKEISLLLNYRL
jgi:hypothetical protein